MPRGDGTGPMGIGPMTGRAAGYCAGYGVPGYMNPIPGRGFWGRGGGRGRGWWRWGAAPMAAPYAPPAYPYSVSPAAPTVKQETEFLKTQAEAMRQNLEAIEKRLAELEAEASGEK
ncbi:MAG TPA: hypothetical protein ENN09_03405 [Planctomycetes bacterium]|nr:hypothetical protein [Planctomycetota bacterium]